MGSDNASLRPGSLEPRGGAAGLQEVRRLEYIALALTLASLLVRWLVMGESVAMMAAILEDLTEVVAPLAILLTLRLEARPADARHPFGYQRIGSLSFFSAAIALLLLGVLTCWRGIDRLLSGVTPDFGDASLLGLTFWQGWLMIGVLFVTSVVMLPVLSAKRKIAPRVRLAALNTDASSNQAHVLVALGAAAGILVTRFGWPLADPLGAVAIGLVILYDGWRDLRAATSELIDVSPEPEVLEELSRVVEGKEYVQAHYWLARKVGRFIDADLLVATDDAPAGELDRRRRELEAELRAINWQLHDLTIAFGRELPLAKQEDGAGRASRDEVRV